MTLLPGLSYLVEGKTLFLSGSINRDLSARESCRSSCLETNSFTFF
jgi:hypothetical protein